MLSLVSIVSRLPVINVIIIKNGSFYSASA